VYLVVATISVSGFAVVGWSAANRVLLLAGNTRPVGLCMVVAAIFNVAANVVLDPVIGLEGAALATLLAYVLLHALTLRDACGGDLRDSAERDDARLPGWVRRDASRGRGFWQAASLTSAS
jgi:hypothetical protein